MDICRIVGGPPRRLPPLTWAAELRRARPRRGGDGLGMEMCFRVGDTSSSGSDGLAAKLRIGRRLSSGLRNVRPWSNPIVHSAGIRAGVARKIAEVVAEEHARGVGAPRRRRALFSCSVYEHCARLITVSVECLIQCAASACISSPPKRNSPTSSFFGLYGTISSRWHYPRSVQRKKNIPNQMLTELSIFFPSHHHV
ncbi:hypothetical protein ACP70R_011070 [Stipagrostis hirtigluma subsp. patula]